MNIAKITNKIALGTVFLLIYWVFIFICTTVFGFKVFKENMTEVFILSILGIFSILCAAIALNIMYNLTAIAEKHKDNEVAINNKSTVIKLGAFVASLFIIFAFLYVGDIATSKKKEQYLATSAEALVAEQAEAVETLADYKFSKEYINSASVAIALLSKIDEEFPRVTAIHQDEINGKQVILGFSSSRYRRKEEPERVDYILSTSKEEREYIYSVFSGASLKYRFSSNDGKHEIYYPVNTNKGIVVLHLSQYSRYGKLGS